MKRAHFDWYPVVEARAQVHLTTIKYTLGDRRILFQQFLESCLVRLSFGVLLIEFV